MVCVPPVSGVQNWKAMSDIWVDMIYLQSRRHIRQSCFPWRQDVSTRQLPLSSILFECHTKGVLRQNVVSGVGHLLNEKRGSTPSSRKCVSANKCVIVF